MDAKTINETGKQLESTVQGMYGSVKFNFQNGKYVNANIEHSIQPEKRESHHAQKI